MSERAGETYTAERHECGCEYTIRRSEFSSEITDYECEAHRRERILRTADEIGRRYFDA